MVRAVVGGKRTGCIVMCRVIAVKLRFFDGEIKPQGEVTNRRILKKFAGNSDGKKEIGLRFGWPAKSANEMQKE